MKNRLFILFSLLVICSAVSVAQEHNPASQADVIRDCARADWNKAAGLDGVYDCSPQFSTPVPKGYEAVYVSHYGRHGSRYAYTEKTYTTIVNMLSEAAGEDNLTPFGDDLLKRLQPFWDDVCYRVGDLTPLGWEQHQYIAETMVRSFPSAFGKGSKVDACSSASVRSIVSMSSFCAAVARFAPKAELYEHQGIMDIQATRPNMGRNPFKYLGPDYPFPYPESSEDFFYRRMPQYKAVLARMFKKPDAALGQVNAYDAFFYLYMLVAGINSLPEEHKLDVSGILTPDEFAILWETDNYERFREYLPYRTSCFSIIDDMIAKADSCLASGGRGAHLRFGHDHVLMSLLMDMVVNDFGGIPQNADDLILNFNTMYSPMAANIQIVFFAPKKKDHGPVLVKILLNGVEASIGDLKPESGPYYRWEDVKAFLEARKCLFVNRGQRIS